jgi:hypothetical protein
MSAANPNPMEKSMVSVLVVANAGGGVAIAVWCAMAEVVKSGGINVQIVLGNGNLGLAAPPTKKRGERRGGAARRLGRKEGVRERGEERRAKVGRPGAGGKEASTTSGGGERVEESRGGRGPVPV